MGLGQDVGGVSRAGCRPSPDMAGGLVQSHWGRAPAERGAEKPGWLLECQLGHDPLERNPQGRVRVTGTCARDWGVG